MDTPFPPELNDPELEKLLNKMDAEFEPLEIAVETHPMAVENECISIVDQMVQEHGGKRILGWQIWKGPYLIEAEFHAVWETPQGTLKDISVKKNQTPVIVFVEDSKLVYRGRQINNVRISLTKNSLVNDFIEVCNIQFSLMNKGRRADLYGQELLKSLTDLQAKNLNRLDQVRGLIWNLLDAGGNEDSLCPCNRGRKYKNCHGAKIKTLRQLD
jgi:hypothetical protein